MGKKPKFVHAFIVPNPEKKTFWLTHVATFSDGKHEVRVHPDHAAPIPMSQLASCVSEYKKMGLTSYIDLNRPGWISFAAPGATVLDLRLAGEFLLNWAGVKPKDVAQ